jgi:transcriptional regulator with GAF, ATPase, and Fis domain
MEPTFSQQPAAYGPPGPLPPPRVRPVDAPAEPAPEPERGPPSEAAATTDDFRSRIHLLQRERIVTVLHRVAGNQTEAAKLLGVSRRTLINWLRRHQIARPRRL